MFVQAGPTRSTSTPSPTVVIFMGVSGCGKSTIGALLAARMRWEFEDADWLHPAASVEKMHSGIPLTDEDRWPWLDAVAAWIDRCRHSRRHGVVACSALKRDYRDILIRDRAAAGADRRASFGGADDRHRHSIDCMTLDTACHFRKKWLIAFTL